MEKLACDMRRASADSRVRCAHRYWVSVATDLGPTTVYASATWSKRPGSQFLSRLLRYINITSHHVRSTPTHPRRYIMLARPMFPETLDCRLPGFIRAPSNE